MKIDMTIVVKNLLGEDVEEGFRNSPEEALITRPLTLAIICIRALTDGPAGKLNAAEKYTNYKLAMKIEEFDEVNLSAEEISNLKQRIAEIYPPIIMGRAWDLLDPKDDDDDVLADDK